MSQYVRKMKDALMNLNAYAQQIHIKIDRNNRDFLPDVAAAENVNLQAQLNDAAFNTNAQIDAIHEEAAAAAHKWAEPTGAEIDSVDIGLLNGSFKLSVKDLHNLLVKHQSNGTMVNAIAGYAKKNDIVLEYIPNLDDKLYVYSNFAQSAKNLVSDIVNSIGISDNSISLKLWAEPGNISQRAELALYGIKQYEEAPKAEPAANFQFNFNHLGGR